MPEIVIYTQPWCPYCERAVYTLTRKGVAFQEINAPNGSRERAEARERSGKTTVPQIFIDGVGPGRSARSDTGRCVKTIGTPRPRVPNCPMTKLAVDMPLNGT
jgi:glutaredoxin 3